MKLFYIFCLSVFPFLSFSQSFNIDASIATDTENQIFLFNFTPGIGYSFTDKDYIFGGLKLQSYSFIPKYDRDENDLWSTTNILNLMLYSGARYSIPIFKTKKGTDSEHTIGFFPECRIYFNPYVPNKLKYFDEDGIEATARGDYATQWAYGIGFGIFIKETENNAYFAFNFEYSNIDAFATFRELDYGDKNFEFPSNKQFSIGISLFFL